MGENTKVIGPFRVELGDGKDRETSVYIEGPESLPGSNFVGAWTDGDLAVAWCHAADRQLREFYKEVPHA